MNENAESAIKLIENLNERAKELKCLYSVDDALTDFESPLDRVFEKILDIIPPGWQYPRICFAKIRIGDDEFKLKDSYEICAKQSAEVFVDDEKAGEIEVLYIDPRRMRPPAEILGECAFLREETQLLKAIAGRIGNYLFNRKLKETFGELTRSRKIFEAIKEKEKKLLKILQNADDEAIERYLSKPSKEIRTPEELESILDANSNKHWKWRYEMAERIAQKLDKERFGVKNLYIFGSAKNAVSGPCSDIDLLAHVDGDERKLSEFLAWTEGWSHCLGEMNYIKTGCETGGLIDLHIITDEDIENKTSYAIKIDAASDGARKLA